VAILAADVGCDLAIRDPPAEEKNVGMTVYVEAFVESGSSVINLCPSGWSVTSFTHNCDLDQYFETPGALEKLCSVIVHESVHQVIEKVDSAEASGDYDWFLLCYKLQQGGAKSY
jgi:hypothetical protein